MQGHSHIRTIGILPCSGRVTEAQPAVCMPGLGLCGPAPQHFVVIAGQERVLLTPAFGAGPSRAPPCPDPATHVWMDNAWRRVMCRLPISRSPVCSAAYSPPLAPPLPGNAPPRRPTRKAFVRCAPPCGLSALIFGPKREMILASGAAPFRMLLAFAVRHAADVAVPAGEWGEGEGLRTALQALAMGRVQWLGEASAQVAPTRVRLHGIPAAFSSALQHHMVSVAILLRRTFGWRFVLCKDGVALPKPVPRSSITNRFAALAALGESRLDGDSEQAVSVQNPVVPPTPAAVVGALLPPAPVVLPGMPAGSVIVRKRFPGYGRTPFWGVACLDPEEEEPYVYKVTYLDGDSELMCLQEVTAHMAHTWSEVPKRVQTNLKCLCLPRPSPPVEQHATATARTHASAPPATPLAASALPLLLLLTLIVSVASCPFLLIGAVGAVIIVTGLLHALLAARLRPLVSPPDRRARQSGCKRRRRAAALLRHTHMLWSTRGLRLGCINACGLTMLKANELYAINTSLNLDIVGVSETWEGRCLHRPVQHYTFLGKPRQNRRGGGVGFYVSRSIAHLCTAHPDTQLAESMWLQIGNGSGSRRPMYIGLVYIPPGDLTTAEAVGAVYASLLRDVRRFQSLGEVVLMGDFNSRVGSAAHPNDHIGQHGEPEADAAGRSLLQLLRATDLFALNNRTIDVCGPAYTRRRVQQTETGVVVEQKSILDYVALPAAYVVPQQGCAPACTLHVEAGRRLSNSDHLLMWFVLPHPTTQKTPASFLQPRPNTFKLTQPLEALAPQHRQQREHYPTAVQAALSAFPAVLADLNMAYEGGRLSAYDACERAKRELCACIDRAVAASIGFEAPTVHPNRPKSYIWSREVKAATRARDVAAAALAAVPLDHATSYDAALRNLRCAQQLVKQTVAAERVRRVQRLVTTVFNCGRSRDSKGVWTALKTLGGARTTRSVGPTALSNPDGPGLVTDDQAICDVLATQYARVSSTHCHYEGGAFDAAHRERIKRDVHVMRTRTSFTSPAPDALCRSIDTLEVAAQCCRLHNHRAPSPLDHIHNELLKYGGPALAAALAAFFNMQFTLETKAKTCGVVTPIYKKGDATEPRNYRPITLGSAIDKLYNMVLNSRIMMYLEEHGKLHDAQHGFRPGRSAVDNVYMLSTCLEARSLQKLDTYLLFLDIEKAYDTVWRAGLLWHLWRKGITGRMFRVLAQMLDHTPSCVMHNGAFSQVMSPDMGWEQGDTLATTMFNVFIDGVLEHVWGEHEGIPLPVAGGGPPANLTALMYADDMVGLAVSPSRLQALADSCRAALTKWHLRASVSTVDTSKTAVMHVHGGSAAARLVAARRASPSMPAIMWGSTVVPQVTEYRYLGAWVTSTLAWGVHLRRRMEAAASAARAHIGVLSQVLLPVPVRKLPLTLVAQPLLSYAAPVWAQPTQAMRRQLDSWQASLATRAFHCPPNTCQLGLQQELGLVPLHVTCEVLAMRYWHRLAGVPADRLLHKVHTAWTGRLYPWGERVHAMLAAYQVSVSEALAHSTKGFKAYLNIKVRRYLDSYWRASTRRSGPVHSRYVDSYGVGEFAGTRPRVRSYLNTLTRQPVFASCKAAEICMHLRLESLSLRAFHSHRRRNETAAAQLVREVCPSCGARPETPAHFLLECPAYAALRSVAPLADVVAQAAASPNPWRVLLARHPAALAGYVFAAWNQRRAALAGRGAYGGDSMASASVPALDVNGA